MEGREIRVLLILALVSVTLCGADDGYCTEDSCSEGTELQDIGETSFQWWNLYEMGKYIINTIKFNVYRKIEQAQNVTTVIVESLEAKVNSAVHGFERFLNRTVKFAEKLYNKTAEFAGEVYDKIIEEFAEKVRVVLREEFDNFLGLLYMGRRIAGTDWYVLLGRFTPDTREREVLKVRISRQGTTVRNHGGRGFRNLTPSLRATARAVFAGISFQQEL